MFRFNGAKLRQLLIIACFFITFTLAACIMGLVNTNGKITLPPPDFHKRCLLYMTLDGGVYSYNNSYCLFPIIGGAVLAFFSLLFLIYWVFNLFRRREFVPKPVSWIMIVLSFMLACLAFAICAEIGIGLNKACNLLGDQQNHCHHTSPFNALWGAEISAGIAGGFYLVICLLELFQLRARRNKLPAATVDTINRTTVVPHRIGTTTITTATGPTVGHGSNKVYTHPVIAQKSEYTEPEMTHPQQQQTYYVPPPPPQPAQPRVHTININDQNAQT
ncbi:hypothetical protein BGZ99_006081 [Dissophora globulifera]|uniref:Uncharacterized protein n=1 Tax=Dissophora globulifera TaxID=979702 RepID=A0A9P6RFF3_9FUNG|nr:hypothetical protein BGZ99_006081 [Dissophora globulifera]